MMSSDVAFTLRRCAHRVEQNMNDCLRRADDADRRGWPDNADAWRRLAEFERVLLDDINRHLGIRRAA